MADDFKVLVPISGGKDSQACLKFAVQIYGAENVRGLFCDTQFEHPKNYAHVELLRTLYGSVQIDVVSGGSVLDKVVKYGRFPGGGSRHCTDELKIRETRIYLAEMTRKRANAPFEVWYGMRLKESTQRKRKYAGKMSLDTYGPHEIMPGKYPKYLAKRGVLFRLAILEWSDADVLKFLAGQHNPLYDDGFPRVGCFPCLATGEPNQELAYTYDDFGREQKRKVFRIANLIGKSPFDGSPFNCNVCEI